MENLYDGELGGFGDLYIKKLTSSKIDLQKLVLKLQEIKFGTNGKGKNLHFFNWKD